MQLTPDIGVLMALLHVTLKDLLVGICLYLQDVQWAVRPCNLVEGRAPLWDLLPIHCGPITTDEIKIVIKKLKYKKVGGADGILPEHLKAIASTSSGLELLVQLCDICWFCHNTPETWKISRSDQRTLRFPQRFGREI